MCVNAILFPFFFFYLIRCFGTDSDSDSDSFILIVTIIVVSDFLRYVIHVDFLISMSFRKNRITLFNKLP